MTDQTSLLDAVATALFWALAGTCVVGIAAAPVIVWLMAAGLRQFDGAVLMTCHDRDVMNRVAGRIIEIVSGKSFDAYLAEKAARPKD